MYVTASCGFFLWVPGTVAVCIGVKHKKVHHPKAKIVLLRAKRLDRTRLLYRVVSRVGGFCTFFEIFAIAVCLRFPQSAGVRVSLRLVLAFLSPSRDLYCCFVYGASFAFHLVLPVPISFNKILKPSTWRKNSLSSCTTTGGMREWLR